VSNCNILVAIYQRKLQYGKPKYRCKHIGLHIEKYTVNMLTGKNSLERDQMAGFCEQGYETGVP
jgi:hypothetical protein